MYSGVATAERTATITATTIPSTRVKPFSFWQLLVLICPPLIRSIVVMSKGSARTCCQLKRFKSICCGKVIPYVSKNENRRTRFEWVNEFFKREKSRKSEREELDYLMKCPIQNMNAIAR